MKIRAVIFDVYRTLLEVGPPPAGAEARWAALCRRVVRADPPGSLAELDQRCREIVSADHDEARRRGVEAPEVWWAGVMARAWPPVGRLDARAQRDFLLEHVGLLREIRLMPGASGFLRWCRQEALALGIASNAQPYSVDELDRALAGAGLGLALFDPRLCVWSCDLGFSKPNPHFFQVVVARLAARAIAPGEALMVGDRDDNDITPARAAGFQTWRIDGEAGWAGLLDAARAGAAHGQTGQRTS